MSTPDECPSIRAVSNVTEVSFQCDVVEFSIFDVPKGILISRRVG